MSFMNPEEILISKGSFSTLTKLWGHHSINGIIKFKVKNKYEHSPEVQKHLNYNNSVVKTIGSLLFTQYWK